MHICQQSIDWYTAYLSSPAWQSSDTRNDDVRDLTDHRAQAGVITGARCWFAVRGRRRDVVVVDYQSDCRREDPAFFRFCRQTKHHTYT